MPFEEKLFTLIANSRVEARRKIVNCFLDERFGTGKGDLSSKYNYIVEQYGEYLIVLKRPARLNKGFDFTVNVNNFYFKGNSRRRHKNPSHDDIITILTQVKNQIGSRYNVIKQIIKQMFYLEEFDLSPTGNIFFQDAEGTDRPIAIILLAIRWLFIEQDVTYWNTSGRAMLMHSLIENGLVDIEGGLFD